MKGGGEGAIVMGKERCAMNRFRKCVYQCMYVYSRTLADLYVCKFPFRLKR